MFGIDTSCCHGGALTGIILPDFRIVSVPSRADYWRQMRNACKPSQQERKPIIWDEEDDAVIGLIRDHILHEHERILGQLRQASAWDEMSAHEQGKMYAEFLGTRVAPPAFLLHLVRRGELTLEKMHSVLQNPDRVRKTAVDLGLMDEDSDEDESSE